MQEINESIPLTDADIKRLESEISTANKGYGIFSLAGFLILGLLAWWLSSDMFLLAVALGIISLLFLIAAPFAYLPGGAEKNKKLELDLKEGKKLRIVAPIEKKDVDEVSSAMPALRIKDQVRDSYKELEFNYHMTVKGYKFGLTEEEYLAGAKKGDFVEFQVAPHSSVILAEPIEIRE